MPEVGNKKAARFPVAAYVEGLGPIGCGQRQNPA